MTTLRALGLTTLGKNTLGKTTLGKTLAAATIAVLGMALVWGASRAGGEPTSAPVADFSTRSDLTSAAGALPEVRARTSATWCGTPSQVDATPNVVAGNPVHWIYAIPSDGEDRFSSFASVMQTDWETIDSWWRSQDPARTPRSDLTQFSCGSQLDLSSVRLPQSSGQLGAPESPFELVWDALVARGFGSDHTKYVIYYDGPVGNEDICGVGGTIPNGLGMAMLLVRACAGIEGAQVVAHELAHAMGAVADGAPHNCAPPDDGHTCDESLDLLYPFTDGTPLSGLRLDPGRDDYYGHGGAWPDLQDSPWLVQFDRQAPFSLTISGPGRVKADVPGLDCTQNCATTWNADTQLTLSPAPGQGAKLVRWTGACAGASQCLVRVGPGSTAAALFAPVTYRLSLRVSGRGSIRSSTSGIACPGRCASAVSSHTRLQLRATPAKGWRLKSWTGACRGKRAVCSLPMTGNASARAVFARR